MDLQRAEELLSRAGFTVAGASRSQASKAWGVTKDKARHILHKLRSNDVESFDQPFRDKCETVTETKDTLSYEIPSTRISSLAELIKQFKVDTSIWEVERWVANKWEVGAKDNNGKIVVEPLFQVKATFRRLKDWNLDSVNKEVGRIKEEAKKVIAPFNINCSAEYRRSDKEDICLEVNIADPHIGKLAWSGETGHADYDSKIAFKFYEQAFTSLLGRPGYDPSKILLVIGNDFLNCDGPLLQTTNGTPQSNDSRYPKMFQTGFDLQVKQIKTALEIAPVEVMCVRGNHDSISMWHLGHSLECMFAGHKHVKIDNSPLQRKYWQHGNNMVMFTHGDMPRGSKQNQSLFSLMPLEAPKEWVASRYREIHLGHLHQKRETNYENTGVMIRIVPSLTAPDYWHYTNGYVGNVRAAQAFEWSPYDGLVGTREFSIDMKAV